MMQLRTSCLALTVGVVGVVGLILGSSVWAASIQEIRIDQTGSDVDEYFELSGSPGESLDDLTYVVIGDGSTGCGTIEEAKSLTGLSIQLDGYFVCGEASATLFTPDHTTSLNFENGDNLTHLLVRGFTGSVADDLDTNDDGVLDSTPWSAIVDCVALLENAQPGCGSPDADDEAVYCATTVGPDGTFVPGHVYRCSGEWRIGPFDPADPNARDTPGDENDCTVGIEDETWSGVKRRYE